MIKSIHSLLFHPLVKLIRQFQFILAVSIFITVALMPSNVVGPVGSSDGILHFVGNFLLFSSAAVVFLNHKYLKTIFICLIPFSLAVELAQSLTPSRQVDPNDMIYNFAGLLCGLVLAHLTARAWSSFNLKATSTNYSLGD